MSDRQAPLVQLGNWLEQKALSIHEMCKAKCEGPAGVVIVVIDQTRGTVISASSMSSEDTNALINWCGEQNKDGAVDVLVEKDTLQ